MIVPTLDESLYPIPTELRQDKRGNLSRFAWCACGKWMQADHGRIYWHRVNGAWCSASHAPLDPDNAAVKAERISIWAALAV